MDLCMDDRLMPAGFPHSEISGSRDICSSPKLFAAYHVFHRLLVPRHPPCALVCLIFLVPFSGTASLACEAALLKSKATVQLKNYFFCACFSSYLCNFLNFWSVTFVTASDVLNILLVKYFNFYMQFSRCKRELLPRLFTSHLNTNDFVLRSPVNGDIFKKDPGSHLLSHAVTSIVPSAANGLTVVFGMRTGVSQKRIATGKVI